MINLDDNVIFARYADIRHVRAEIYLPIRDPENESNQVKPKILYCNTRKMNIGESTRLKPIRAYFSFISIMSLINNDLILVEQVSKSAGSQQTRHAMKVNHYYVKNSILPPCRRSNEIAPAQHVFWENNGVALYLPTYLRTYLPTYLPTLPTYPTYLPTYLPIYIYI